MHKIYVERFPRNFTEKLLRRIFIQFSSSRTKCTRSAHQRNIRNSSTSNEYSRQRRRFSILLYFTCFLPGKRTSAPFSIIPLQVHACTFRPRTQSARSLPSDLWIMRNSYSGHKSKGLGIFRIVQTNIPCLVSIRRTVASANKALSYVFCVYGLVLFH